MNIRFEPANPADAEALVEAQIAAFHYDSVLYPEVEISGPPGYDSAEVMRGKISSDLCYKIVVDGDIAGGFVLYAHGEDAMHLDVIFIHPDFHDRGIGSKAMAFIEAAHPAKLWTLHTPSWAVRNQHFYEKFGYVKVGEDTEIEPGLVLYAYEKRS